MSAAERLTVPCVNLELEARYIGACLVDGEALERHRLWPRELWAKGHRDVLEAMLALRGRGLPTDPVSVSQELERMGALKRNGGEAWVRSLTAVVELHPGPLAARLRELAVAREARERAMRGVAEIEGGELANGLKSLREAGELRHPDEASSERYGTLAEAVKRAAADVAERAARAEARPACVATGIKALDEQIVGIEYGDCTVIGGDTSAGKSTLLMHMAIEMAKAGHRPGYISCEDAEERISRRALSMLSGVPSIVLRTAKGITKWQAEQIRGATVEVDGIGVELSYCVGEDLDVVMDATRVLLREKGCDVVFLDYLQAVGVPGQEERIAVKTVMSRFKRECNRVRPAASGVVLSQFRRRGDKVHQRPTRSDLYESGYIEQKADTIILIWMDEEKRTRGVLDKAKDDATGVTFMFERKGGKFCETTPQQGVFKSEADPGDGAPSPKRGPKTTARGGKQAALPPMPSDDDLERF